MFYDREIVGDEEVGEALAALQVLEEVYNLRLNGHVQGGNRLVADDKPRFHSQRPGYPDSLTLSARKLVRIAIDMRRVETDHL
jgi:hypothetical protein